MRVISSQEGPSGTRPDDPHARVLAIEGEIEGLSDYAERCRKAMRLSRIAIVAGALLFIAAITGFLGEQNAAGVVGGFAAMIGGIVWLGASKSSGEETAVALRGARAELAQAIDELGLQRLN